MRAPKVVVVGVGAMGAATCWQLAQRGAQVIGLEQFAIGHDRGSSHGESRLIRKAYFEHPDYVPLLQRAFDLWHDLGNWVGTPLLQRTGLALAGKPSSVVVSGTLHSAQQYGISTAVFDDAARCPGLRAFALPADYCGVVEFGAGWLPVEQCVATMARRAEILGAELRPHCTVLDWSLRAGGVQVVTSAGTLLADRLVLTQGAWSHAALRHVGVPFTAHRNLLFWLPASAVHSSHGCFGLDLPLGFIYGFPRTAGLVKLALHRPGETVDDPATVDRTLYASDTAAFFEVLADHAPGLSRDVARHAVCLYECSPDGHFVIDKLPGAPPVVVAGGFSGHGFKFAPAIGQALAELTLTGTTALPTEFLSARRFAVGKAPG